MEHRSKWNDGDEVPYESILKVILPYFTQISNLIIIFIRIASNRTQQNFQQKNKFDRQGKSIKLCDFIL